MAFMKRHAKKEQERKKRWLTSGELELQWCIDIYYIGIILLYYTLQSKSCIVDNQIQ